MAVITQNLAVPSTLATGQTAQAADVVALYNTFNAQTIPDTIGVLQIATVDDSLTTLTLGGTVTKDYTVVVVKTKAIKFLLSFQWAGLGAAAPTVQLRINGSATSTATALTNAVTGNCLITGWIGAHDTTDANRPAQITVTDHLNTAVTNIFLNADLPNVDTSSMGLTVGGGAGAGTFKLKYARFWREG